MAQFDFLGDAMPRLARLYSDNLIHPIGAKCMYQKAWELLLKKIETQTSWGKIQLKQVMLEALIEAGKTSAR